MEKKGNKGALVTLAVGLALNITLGVAKMIVGTLASSMSVTSDALNNLSDAVVSIITIIAVALAARSADHGHPYGHGRYEYIAAFVLGAVVAAVGIEVLSGGIKRAIMPETPQFDSAVWITLGLSVGVKAFMSAFYYIRGRAVGSQPIKAAAADSLSDAAVTLIVLVCAVIERHTGAHIDGYASIAVALFILLLAVRLLKSVIDRLLGSRPDPALADAVNSAVMARPEVMSVHDLIINDYGERNKIAEIDAVFPASMSFVDVHAACDAIEKEVYRTLEVRLSIHADPHMVDDPRLVEITKNVCGAIAGLDASAHDIEIDDDAHTVRLDITVGGKSPLSEIRAIVNAEIAKTTDYAVEIGIDYI